MKRELPKIIAIIGPTSSGKSNLAVKLAKKTNGEIISADSRQVYRKMDIGTGKVPRDKSKIKKSHSRASSAQGVQKSKLQIKTQKEKNYFYKGIRHHLLDVASPKRTFTVTRYVSLAKKAATDILKRGKIPIICGGTGFYIHAFIDGIAIPEIPPNHKLREKLGRKLNSELFALLQKQDPSRAAKIDQKNKRRLIRALEINAMLGKVPKLTSRPRYNALFIGINLPPEKLQKKIRKRLLARLKQGMVEEVQVLHNKMGVSWKKLESFGLEYRHIARYLQHQISYSEMARLIELDTWRYAKRQLTWFRRNSQIQWIDSDKRAIGLAKKFLAS